MVETRQCADTRVKSVLEYLSGQFSQYITVEIGITYAKDTQHCVEDSLITNDHSRKWCSADSDGAHNLMADVVTRANGVILGMALLVGLSIGDGSRDLPIRSQQIPADLEEFLR